MPELVVISGKGGTGKTTVLGSFAVMAKNKVLADADVDAPNLHLLLAPENVSERKARIAGSSTTVRPRSTLKVRGIPCQDFHQWVNLQCP